MNKFKNDNEFKELSNLKEIHKDLVMKGCELTKCQLDPRVNRNDGWGVGENREENNMSHLLNGNE